MREYSVSGCKIINIFLYGQIFLTIFYCVIIFWGGDYFDRLIFFGRVSFVGRRFSQIGNANRARIFFIVGSRFLTRIGTPACFAAAGSARIEGAGDYRGWITDWLR